MEGRGRGRSFRLERQRQLSDKDRNERWDSRPIFLLASDVLVEALPLKLWENWIFTIERTGT